MIRMEDEDTVHSAVQGRTDMVLLRWDRMKHMQEVPSIAQVISGMDEWLADIKLVRPGRDRWRFGNQAECADSPIFGITNVETVVIECGERARHAAHHR